MAVGVVASRHRVCITECSVFFFTGSMELVFYAMTAIVVVLHVVREKRRRKMVTFVRRETYHLRTDFTQHSCAKACLTINPVIKRFLRAPCCRRLSRLSDMRISAGGTAKVSQSSAFPFSHCLLMCNGYLNSSNMPSP